MIAFPPKVQRRLDAIRALEQFQPEVLLGMLLEIEVMLREGLDKDGEGESGVDLEEGEA